MKKLCLSILCLCLSLVRNLYIAWREDIYVWKHNIASFTIVHFFAIYIKRKKEKKIYKEKPRPIIKIIKPRETFPRKIKLTRPQDLNTWVKSYSYFCRAFACSCPFGVCGRCLCAMFYGKETEVFFFYFFWNDSFSNIFFSFFFSKMLTFSR